MKTSRRSSFTICARRGFFLVGPLVGKQIEGIPMGRTSGTTWLGWSSFSLMWFAIPFSNLLHACQWFGYNTSWSLGSTSSCWSSGIWMTSSGSGGGLLICVHSDAVWGNLFRRRLVTPAIPYADPITICPFTFSHLNLQIPTILGLVCAGPGCGTLHQ